MTKSGWYKYSAINLQYKNQVVAKIRDAEDKTSDSLRALQMMQVIAERAAKQASDSLQFFTRATERQSADSSMIQQSFQREDEGNDSDVPVPAPVTVAPAEVKRVIVPVKVTPAVTKPAVTKPVVVKKPVAKPAPVVKKKVATKPTPVKPAATKPATAKPPPQKPKAVMQ